MRQRHRSLALGVLSLDDDLCALSTDPGLPELANAIPMWRDLAHDAAHLLGDPTSLAGQMGPMRLQVGVVGRTESGKSTLVNALLARPAAQVGAGYQRTTRTTTTYRLSGLVDIVDTPGVAAVDGTEDEFWTTAAAHRADLIVYVISSDQLSGPEAQALSTLNRSGRPCLLVLNVKYDIDGRPKGRDLRARRRRFLEKPESVFIPRDLEAHAERVAEAAPGLWRRGGERLLPIHALAGAMAADDTFAEDAERLWDTSRVGRLRRVLEQTARRRLPTARVTEVIQPFVLGIEAACENLQSLHNHLDGAITHIAEVGTTTASRVDAIVAEHEARFRNRVAKLLAPIRADLPELADLDDISGLRERWQSRFEDAGVVEEFERSLGQLADAVADVLKSPVPTAEGITWKPPRIHFDLSIDMGEIVLEALLEGAERVGFKWAIRMALRRLASRGAAAGAGGPWGTVVYVLLELTKLARSVQVGRRRAQNRKREELIQFMRGLMDATAEALPRHFRRRITDGDLGEAIEAHQRNLESTRNALQRLRSRVDDLIAQAASRDREWITLQLSSLQELSLSAAHDWRVDRRDNGDLVMTSGNTAPWAAVVQLEYSTGVRVRMGESAPHVSVDEESA